MIAKISQGSGFRGALNYILKKDSETIGGNMAGDDPRGLSREFGITRALREDIKKPCYHISLTLPKGEELDTTQWQKVANKYLSRMGISPTEHQYILVQHKDTELNHVHILASRIALDGKVWKPEFDKMKSKDICRQLEEEHNLTLVSNEKKQYRAKTTQKERRMSERTGREPEKVYVQKVINELLPEGVSLSPQIFCAELEKHGIIAIPNVATTGKMNGFSFQYAGRSYTGSQIGYAWKHLEKFIDMKSEDVVWMQARKNRLQQGTPADAVRSIRNAVWETGILGVPFSAALEKQGWTISGDRITKGETAYDLAAIVDPEALRANLRTLETVGKKAKEQAQQKSRELARKYYAKPRKSFLAEMKTEDVLCGMVLFPGVVIFLLILSVLTESIRQMDRPSNQEEFAARMKEIWQGASTEVQAEVKKAKEEIRNARLARSNPANISVTEKAGRGLRTADESGQSRMREMGTGVDTDDTRGERYTRRDTRYSGLPPVETKNPDSNDGDGLHRGREPVAVGLEPTRSESSDDKAPPASWGAIEEWANLAQDISALTRGEDMSKVKEKSKSVLYKEQVWDRQHSALQAPLYRLTVRGRADQDGKVINLCKDKSGVEHLWTADEVRKQIPSLEYWNARNYDIYITPMDDNFHHLLLDDLTQKGVEYIKARYDVSLVQTSSKDNFQAIIRVPKKEVSTGEQTAGNLMLRELNHLPDGYGGDKSISAPRHPFRMVGFHNKKPNKHNLQTKIEYMKPDTTCERATKELERIRTVRLEEIQKIKELRIKNDMTVRLNSIETVGDISVQRPEGETAADKDFRFRWNRILGLAKIKVKEGLWADVDRSAIDYRVCKELLENGYSEQATVSAMHRCSPSIYDRHDNPDDYIRRTVSRAVQDIEKTNERGDIPFFNDGR